MTAAIAASASAPRAAIYCRISKDDDGAGAGVARQEADCRRLAQSRGWDVVGVYVDNDTSAFNGTRPRYRRLLADIAARTVDAVVTWHPDRLHRQPMELEQFFQVCDRAKLTKLASVAGDYDLASHDARMQARIMGAVARNSSDATARRIRRKHEELAQAGKVHGGGIRPFGYDPDGVTLRPAEAKWIKVAARKILAGDSLRSVVRETNAAGVRTSQGKPWIASGLRNLLKTGRIAGVREHHGELVMKEVNDGEAPKHVKAAWPAIITLAECKRLRALLSDPNRRSLGRGTARSYLLTGFIHCGRKTCGTPLVSRPKAGGLRCYMCAHDVRRPKACGQLTTRAEPVEELVTAELFKVVDSPALARAIADQAKVEKHEREKAKDAAEVISEVEHTLEQLSKDYYVEKRIKRHEWLAMRELLERRLAAAQNEFSAEQRTAVLDGFIGKSGALRRAWHGMTIDRQRAILAVVIDRVDIAPVGRKHGPTFDPSRVSVRWRY